MLWYQTILKETFNRGVGGGVYLITKSVRNALQDRLPEVKTGLLNIFLTEANCSLSLNENADPTVRTDILNAMDKLIPSSLFPGSASPSSILPSRAVLFGHSLSIPISRGNFVLGTWQGIYLCKWGVLNEGEEANQVNLILTLTSFDSENQTSLTVRAPSRGCHPIESEIMKSFPIKSINNTICNITIQHTSASICQNYSQSPQKPIGETLERNLNAIVPEKWNNEFFEHTYEGPDDMPGHLKSSLVGASLDVPINNGLIQGSSTSQGLFNSVYLCEHRNTGGWGIGHSRTLVVSVLPEPIRCVEVKTDLSRAEEGWKDITDEIERELNNHSKGDVVGGGLLYIEVIEGEILLTKRGLTGWSTGLNHVFKTLANEEVLRPMILGRVLCLPIIGSALSIGSALKIGNQLGVFIGSVYKKEEMCLFLRFYGKKSNI